MSPTVTRLLLSLALVAGAPCVYPIVFMIIGQRSWARGTGDFLITNLVVGIPVAVCWILIWRRQVAWTARQLFHTCLVFVGASVLIFPLFFVITGVMRGGDEGAMVLTGMCWAIMWMVGTTLFWEETPLERAKRRASRTEQPLLCPKCSYNMTGLHEARCPECGTQYTLDELLRVVVEDPSDLDND